MKNILVVDDDRDYLEVFKELFSSDYGVELTYSAKEALELCSKNKYDLVIVDYFMDEMNGETFTSIIKSFVKNQRILVISGSANADEQINILSYENVDYVDKLTPPEVIVKRVERIIGKTVNNEQEDVRLFSEVEGIEIDSVYRRVIVNGDKKSLSNKEHLLLVMFLSNKNIVLTREEIYETIWGKEDKYSNLRIVDINVLKLRKKLGIRSIFSQRGIGYVWEE